jgi:NADPH:quinone reductase
MSNRIPETIRALELRSYEHDSLHASLTLVEKPCPRPGKAEVLVRITAAPVNPSDLMFLRGLYGVRRPLPTIPGFEGSGTVVAAGGGLWARALLGRRVACGVAGSGDGTWSEYTVVPVTTCFPLGKHTSNFQGAMMLVNPMTAWALVDGAQRGGHRAFVQTAAAGALGGMIRRLAGQFDLPVINVVRHAAQIEELRAQGTTYVLNSSASEFDQQLRELCHQLGATLALDAVAGELPDRLLSAMPRGARVTVYGALSGEPAPIDPRALIFRQQQVDGFWLTDWLKQQSLLEQLRAGSMVQRLLRNELKTIVRAALPLADALRGIDLYTENMSAGKVLLVPGLRKR